MVSDCSTSSNSLRVMVFNLGGEVFDQIQDQCALIWSWLDFRVISASEVLEVTEIILILVLNLGFGRNMISG